MVPWNLALGCRPRAALDFSHFHHSALPPNSYLLLVTINKLRQSFFNQGPPQPPHLGGTQVRLPVPLFLFSGTSRLS